MTNPRQIIFTVQQQFDAFDALLHYGKIQHKREQQILCPFHADKQKSARIYESSEKTGRPALWCFSCGRLWDGVAIVSSMENIGYAQAAYLIYGQFGKTFTLLEVPDDWGSGEGPKSPQGSHKVVDPESPYAIAWRQERSRLERAIKKSALPLETRIRLYTLSDLIEKAVRENDQFLWEPRARTIWEKLNYVATPA